MEVWNYFRFFICVFPNFHCFEALEPSHYVGCFKDNIFRKVVWKSQITFNSGALCIRTCRASGHKYAATQSQYCTCGISLRGDLEPSKCEYKCPGYQNEICGGPNGMSVYTISSVETKPTPPADTETNALITSTEAITSFTEQVAYNDAPETKTAPTTETYALITSTENITSLTEDASNDALETKPAPTTETNALITSIQNITSYTEQNAYNEGKADSGRVAAYISLPVFGIVVVGGTLACVIFICRRNRTHYGKYSCHYRNEVTKNCPLYMNLPGNSYDFNIVKDEDGFKNNTDDVQKSSSNIYTEIPSELVSERYENDTNTASFALHPGRWRIVESEANGSYDTIQSLSKDNTLKSIDSFKTRYDHVVIGNQNKRTDDTNYFSKLDTGVNSVHSNQLKVSNYYTNYESASDRTSSMGGKDGQSLREYIVFEEDGHYIVHL